MTCKKIALSEDKEKLLNNKSFSLVELSIVLLGRFCEVVKQPKQSRATRISLAGLQHQRCALARNSAFSLVELSIVLVILGLLTGGILTGQNLIRAAELRSVTTEFANYQTAIHTFRDKYFAMPGDMTNAEAFWGTMATGTCPAATGGTGTQTCNGDGDGMFDWSGFAASQTNEQFTFWQHLANAGLIEGSYTGIAGTVDQFDADVGVNTPVSKLQPGTFMPFSYAGGAVGTYLVMEGKDVMLFGVASGNSPQEAIMKPEEMWNIDTKIDDGKPGYGNLHGFAASARPGCTTTDSAATAEYDLDNTSITCPLIFDLR